MFSFRFVKVLKSIWNNPRWKEEAINFSPLAYQFMYMGTKVTKTFVLLNVNVLILLSNKTILLEKVRHLKIRECFGNLINKVSKKSVFSKLSSSNFNFVCYNVFFIDGTVLWYANGSSLLFPNVQYRSSYTYTSIHKTYILMRTNGGTLPDMSLVKNPGG